MAKKQAWILTATPNEYDAVDKFVAWWSDQPTMEQVKAQIVLNEGEAHMLTDPQIYDLTCDGATLRYNVGDKPGQYGYWTYNMNVYEEAI